jgi:hypothetical protein
MVQVQLSSAAAFAVSLTGEKTEFLGQAPRKLHENSIVTFQ